MLRRIAIPLLLATCASTQGVTVRAKTLQGMVVKVLPGTMQSIPASTDITAGAALSATGTQNPLASAQATFALASTPESVQLTFSTGANAVGGLVSAGAASGPNDVEATLVSVAPTRVKISVEYCGSIGGPVPTGAASLTVSIPGVGGFTYVPSGNPLESCLVGPKIATYPAQLDATGLIVRLAATASGSGGGGYQGSGFVRATVTIRPAPDWPIRAVPYGASCGPSLATSTDFAFPGSTLVTLSDPRAPQLGWFLLGTQKLQVPILGCVLHNDLVVLLPALLDNQGVARVRVVPPPVPNGYCVAQGATWDATTLLSSGGLELFCY